MKKKVLVLGATGMAGHMVYFYLSKTGRYEMFNTVFRNKLTEDSIICDVRNEKGLNMVFSEINPDLVINCIGALIKESRENPDNAIFLNACLPHLLKRHCDKTNAKLIHLSTDCVFSGKRGKYAEDDFRDADDVYGRSKALGEIINDKDVTLRTSIIGPELKTDGQGLLHWFLHQEGEVQGYTKVFWSGITTLELARAIHETIKQNLSGLFHVTNGLAISKYDLLRLFHEIFPSRITRIQPFSNFKSDKTIQVSAKHDFKVPGYEKMLKELTTFYTNFDQTRKQL